MIRNELKLSLEMAFLVAINVNEAMVGSGGICVWREPGSVAVKMFLCLIYFIKAVINVI